MSDEKRLERIEQKVDDTNDHLASIDKTLVEQHITLKEHMARTKQLEEEFKPVREHVIMMKGALKLISILTGLGALYELFKRLL